MKKFIRELRRREVFRTAGLYVGISWILIEASSVLLPTFDAPEWIMKAVVIVVVVGFPVMLVLAWVYDITDSGVEVQADPTDTMVAPLGSRKMDFVVIGILSVALILSLYMNFTTDPAVLEDPDPVSVLIADFSNETSNPLFDGILEQALNIGVESAPHVTSYQRTSAKSLAARLQPDLTTPEAKLDLTLASLIAVREGIQLVLAGSIQPKGDGFDLHVDGFNPTESTNVFEISRHADSSATVLQVVGELSKEVREELGDTTLRKGDSPIAETFTAASLEAAKAYTTALQFAYEGRHDDAVENYRVATELDEKFGRAYSGWALSEFKLGRTADAEQLWEKALSLMETMTERERLRTLGLYYASVTGNFESAVESFSELVEKYPADAAGHNNLAVASFLTLDFARASEEGLRIMEIYPASELYRSNYALYSMYSGDFATATTIASELVSDNPEYGTAYLPIAISGVARGDFDAARMAYNDMSDATASEHTSSLATLGLADLAIYSGEFDVARSLLVDGIASDVSTENHAAVAVKNVALAQLYAAAGENDNAVTVARRALELSGADSTRVAVAQVLVAAGLHDEALEIASDLVKKLQPQSRAYGLMIQAAVHRSRDDNVEAVDLLRRALDLADLWLIRVELGRNYLEADFFAEALSEFMTCQDRRGEAAAVFLDDTPSYRYMAELPYWIGRAQEGIGMQSSAVNFYEQFLALRPEGGPLADDTRQRLQ